ncbi:MAG: amidohydrolase family protein [Verrucomicrobia bacterium]|nr:amidohydrolase family protein [Verrucomicrobiota bacterium]
MPETVSSFQGARARLVRVRCAAPLAAPPIENAAVWIAEGRIRAVGPWPELKDAVPGKPEDLGEALLLPAFLNAHCHLEYTDFADRFRERPRGFVDWIERMIAAKRARSLEDARRARRRGARMLLQSGVARALDIVTDAALAETDSDTSPLRVASFLECLAPSPGEREKAELARIDKAAPLLQTGRIAGLSPHAPYSAAPGLIRRCAQLAAALGLPLSIHAAESREEWEMFARAEGPLYQWLQARGRPMDDCGGATPIRRLAELGALGPRTWIAHANCLDEGDVGLLARSGATVVHCPRSHAYFGHPPFPLEKLRCGGVPVCLGTDSLAGTAAEEAFPKLDLFAELAACAREFPGLGKEEIVRMATVEPARAGGWAGQAGELRPGAVADLAAIPFRGAPAEAFEAIVAHRGPVLRMMLQGEWIDV